MEVRQSIKQREPPQMSRGERHERPRLVPGSSRMGSPSVKGPKSGAESLSFMLRAEGSTQGFSAG